MPDTSPMPACPCLLCGTDYLANPTTATSATTADLPAGCECPGCVTTRAEIEALHATGTLTPEQGLAYLSTIRMEIATPSIDPWSYHANRTLHATICPSCIEVVLAVNADSCPWCDARSAQAISDLLGLTNAAGAPMDVTGVRISRRGLDPNRRISWQHAMNYAHASGTTDGSEHLCQGCEGNASWCDHCDMIMSSDSAYTCEDCEVTACSDCYYRRHDGHGDSTRSYDNERYSFAARVSIPQALATLARPGTTILSTRALGVEIETARGSASPVIAAERIAPFPVLAGVGTDGSVRGRNAVEYRLLPLRGTQAEYGLRSMASWCRDAGYAPDETAGIHMHVDCSDLPVAGVYRAFAALLLLEGVFYSHAAPARLVSTYCRPYGSGAATVVQQAINAARESRYFDYNAVGQTTRYHSINSHSYSAHRTLEVRVFDSNHDEAEVVRFTDAAAIIAGAVDFANSPAWATFEPTITTDGPLTSIRLLAAMAVGGFITDGTFVRATARIDSRISTGVAA